MIGGIVGGPWGMVIAVAGAAIDYAMTDAQQVGKLDDKNMLITSYGQPIQKFWGTARVSGVAIWCTELEENRERSKGKGGGGGKQDIYTYKGNLAIAVNDNPVSAYLDIIKDSKELIYTSNKYASKASLIASQDFAEAIRFYYADVNQRPDPFIQSVEGVGKTPAYRDLSYFVIEGFETKTPYAPSFEVVSTTSAIKDYVHHEIHKETLGAYDNSNYCVEVIDYNRYKTFLMVDNYTCKVTFLDSSGAKENNVSVNSDVDIKETMYSYNGNGTIEFEKTYYNDLGQVINFISFNLPRTTKGGNVFTGLTNSGTYIIKNGAIHNEKAGAKNYTNVQYLKKNGSDVLFYEVANVGYINDVAVPYLLRDIDSSVNAVYLSTFNKILKVTDNNFLSAETLYHNTVTSANSNGAVQQVCVISDDLIYFTEKSGTGFNLRKIENGVVSTVRALPSTAAVANYIYSENGESFLFLHNYNTFGGGQSRAIYFNTPTYEGSFVYLSDIVRDLLRMAKSGEDEYLSDFNIEDVDLTDLEGIEVKGFVIKTETSAREALEKLAQCFFFEAKESDGKLVFVRRGKKPIAIITEADLSAKEGSRGENSNDFLDITRAHDSTLYNEIRVNYIDTTADFKINSQYDRRQSTNSVNAKTFDLGVAMTPDEARTIATKILDSYWKCRTEYKFKISLKHSYLEPADVITLNVFGNLHTMRITKLHSQNGVIEVTAISEDPAIYNQKSVGATIDKTIDSEVTLSPATNLQLLDIPYLRDQDSQVQGVYVAAGPHVENSKWRGCSLLKSLDMGASYGGFKDFTKKATLGVTLNKLGNFSNSGLLDNQNYVTVKTNGNEDLTSIDFTSMLNGGNLALIGNEIIQFMFAEAIDTNTYNLYGLLRGCRGTEHHASTHTIEDRFVLLTTDTIDFVAMSSADFDISGAYKAVTFGGYSHKTSPFSFKYEGQAFECYSPVNVNGGYHSNGATLKWTRRARLNHSWNNFVDVPLDQAQEIYEIEILKDGNVIRTLQSNTPTIEYSNAQILEDFTTKPTSINFNVYQISELRGRGNVGKGIIK